LEIRNNNQHRADRGERGAIPARLCFSNNLS
jgi:hypothetical protein